MTEPRHVTGLWLALEDTPGTAQAIAAGDALAYDREGAPPTREGLVTPREIAAPRADHVRSSPAVQRLWRLTTPPIHMQYGISTGELAGDTPPRALSRLAQIAGYVEAITAADPPTHDGRVNWSASGAPNAGSQRESATIRVEAGPATDGGDDGKGKRWDAKGCRGQVTWLLDQEGPHRATLDWTGGYVSPVDFTSATAQTHDEAPLVLQPSGFQLVETSLRDASHEVVYSSADLLVMQQAQITSPFAPDPQADFRPYGWQLPVHLAAGAPSVQLTLQVRDIASLPIETWIDEAEHIRLRLRWLYDDSAGDGGVLRHVARGCQVREKAWDASGPLRVTLTLAASSVGALPSHEIQMAEALADLSALSDDPS